MKRIGNLKKISMKKLNKLYDGKIPEYVLKRYNYEIKIIYEKKLENNYLLAYKIVEKAKKDNSIIIDRISGSSYIDYLLGMTFINPIKYNLSNDLREDMTFYCGVSKDYYQIIYDYLKVIFKKYKLSNEFNINELKRYGISLEINSYAYKLELLGKETKIERNKIDLEDINVYNNLDLNEVLLYRNNSKKNLFNIFVIDSIDKLANVYSLIQSDLDINDSEFDIYKFELFPYTRDHIYDYLLKHHIEKEDALLITKFIHKGYVSRDKMIWNRYKNYLVKHNIEFEYINILEKVCYLWPKSICITRAIIIYWLSFYKLYYPEEYYKVIKFYEGDN